jgi:hypothetical protein
MPGGVGGLLGMKIVKKAVVESMILWYRMPCVTSSAELIQAGKTN